MSCEGIKIELFHYDASKFFLQLEKNLKLSGMYMNPSRLQVQFKYTGH